MYKSKTSEVGSHKTSVYTDSDGLTKVVYHNTPVVSFNQDKIILNTGGWSTNTTKLRMNQASNQFRLGYRVYQKAFDWYVDFAGQVLKFENNTLELDRNALVPSGWEGV